MRFFCPKKAKFYLKLSQLKGESCAVVLFYLFFWASVTGTVVGTVWFGGNFGLVSLLIFSFEMARALSTFQHVLRPLCGPHPPPKKRNAWNTFCGGGKTLTFFSVLCCWHQALARPLGIVPWPYVILLRAALWQQLYFHGVFFGFALSPGCSKVVCLHVSKFSFYLSNCSNTTRREKKGRRAAAFSELFALFFINGIFSYFAGLSELFLWKLAFEQIAPESDLIMRAGLHTRRSPPALSSLSSSSSSTPKKTFQATSFPSSCCFCFVFLQGNFVSGKNLSEIFGCGKYSQSFRAVRMLVTLSPMLENQTWSKNQIYRSCEQWPNEWGVGGWSPTIPIPLQKQAGTYGKYARKNGQTLQADARGLNHVNLQAYS